MSIITVSSRTIVEAHKRKAKVFTAFQRLLGELQKRDLSPELEALINREIEQLNALETSDRNWYKELKKARTRILKEVHDAHRLVPKAHYRNRWIAMGMTTCGLPIGMAIAAISGNYAFISIGISLGLPIGLLIGNYYDQKAFNEGRQLNVDVPL